MWITFIVIITQLLFIEWLLCITYCAVLCIRYLLLLHENSVCGECLPLYYTWENWDSETRRNLLKNLNLDLVYSKHWTTRALSYLIFSERRGFRISITQSLQYKDSRELKESVKVCKGQRQKPIVPESADSSLSPD
jgi:hypothetical protein